MTRIAVLQARTSSTRLPAKVLLPIAGMPIAVLAAKRAANTGRKIIVATSDDSSDDVFAATVRQHSLAVFRGSLHNTLDRVTRALSSFDDDAIVFRLTADNVVPDGELLDEIEADFITRNLEYLSCNGEPSGLPYGVSAEVTRLKHIREAAANAVSAADKEHVTPYIIRKFGARHFAKYKHRSLGLFRCTVDNFDDYVTMQRLFQDIDDAVGVSALDLTERLKGASGQPTVSRAASDMVLGGAQLGSHYGVTNTSGPPTASEAERLLKTAITNGVQWLDTARAYPNSEQVISTSLAQGWTGRARIITKLSPLSECADTASETEVRAWVDASIHQSCSALRQHRLDVLLLHRAQHLHAWQGAAWRRLQEHHQQGLIGTLGVSVQSPAELATALEENDVVFIQMPFNILDWRWRSVLPTLARAKSERALTVHARSALLQGLLQSNNEANWQRANVTDSAGIRTWLSAQASTIGRQDVADLCFAYVRSQDWVDGVVVGTEQLSQLRANLNYFDSHKLSAEQILTLEHQRPEVAEQTLDPSQWQ